MPADSFRRQRAVLALAAGLCASGCALAQADAPAETFEQLAAQEADRAGDPDFDSALGRAAYASGHFPRAVLAWERVLLVQPDNVAAQLALGRALFAVGDKRAALAVSPAVREQGIPVDAAVAMDQFLVSYDRADYHGASSAKGYVELAAGHDSNANVGPDSALGRGAERGGAKRRMRVRVTGVTAEAPASESAAIPRTLSPAPLPVGEGKAAVTSPRTTPPAATPCACRGRDPRRGSRRP